MAAARERREDLAVDAGVVWRLVGAGSVGAIGVALWLCWPPVRGVSRGVVLLHSFFYVGAVLGAGWVGVRLLWAMLDEEPRVRCGWLLLCAGMGWVFLPCLVLLGREKSLWMVPSAMVAAVGMTLCVRMLLPVEMGVAEVESGDGPLRFKEMDGWSRGWWWAVGIALGLEGVAGLAAGEWIACASLLLAVCGCAVTWRWSLRSRRCRTNLRARLAIAAAMAVLLAAMLQVPPANGGYAPVMAKVVSTPHPGAHYESIILWPVKKKEPPHAPELSASMLGVGKKAPTVIPFDGPYWYVEAPETLPDALARLAHGDPVLDFIRTTDGMPLQMTAHQRLASPIALSCCAEMDVALTNGDHTTGEIAVRVIVTDSSDPKRPSVVLGQEPIVSSEGKISINRAPVDEVLRFRIPAQSRVKRFDEITVVFVPQGARAWERTRVGARVGLREFRLLPR